MRKPWLLTLISLVASAQTHALNHNPSPKKGPRPHCEQFLMVQNPEEVSGREISKNPALALGNPSNPRLRHEQDQLEDIANFQNIAHVHGIDLHIYRRPFMEAGSGDFLNFTARDDGKISLLIGDVERKGEISAQESVRLHHILESADFNVILQGAADARKALIYIDHTQVFEKRKLALAHILFDPENGRLHFNNAGFEDLYIVTNQHEVIRLATARYPYLAYPLTSKTQLFKLGQDMVYDLQPGDTVFISSDWSSSSTPTDVELGERTELHNQLLEMPASTDSTHIIKTPTQAPTSPQALIEFALAQFKEIDDDQTIVSFQWQPLHPSTH